jgi:hypothetical protein
VFKLPNVSGEKFLEEVAETCALLAKPTEACRKFVEIMSVDSDVKVASENADGDDGGEGDLTASDGIHLNGHANSRATTPDPDRPSRRASMTPTPGSGQNRSRKRKSESQSRTPGNRKRRNLSTTPSRRSVASGGADSPNPVPAVPVSLSASGLGNGHGHENGTVNTEISKAAMGVVPNTRVEPQGEFDWD